MQYIRTLMTDKSGSKMEAEINRLKARIELLERGASDQVSDSESDEDVERNSDSEYHPSESEDESSSSEYEPSEVSDSEDESSEDEEEERPKRVQHCSYCGEPEHKTTTCIHRWTVVLDNLRCPDHAIRAYVTRRDV